VECTDFRNISRNNIYSVSADILVLNVITAFSSVICEVFVVHICIFQLFFF